MLRTTTIYEQAFDLNTLPAGICLISHGTAKILLWNTYTHAITEIYAHKTVGGLSVLGLPNGKILCGDGKHDSSVVVDPITGLVKKTHFFSSIRPIILNNREIVAYDCYKEVLNLVKINDLSNPVYGETGTSSIEIIVRVSDNSFTAVSDHCITLYKCHTDKRSGENASFAKIFTFKNSEQVPITASALFIHKKNLLILLGCAGLFLYRVQNEKIEFIKMTRKEYGEPYDLYPFYNSTSLFLLGTRTICEVETLKPVDYAMGSSEASSIYPFSPTQMLAILPPATAKPKSALANLDLKLSQDYQVFTCDNSTRWEMGLFHYPPLTCALQKEIVTQVSRTIFHKDAFLIADFVFDDVLYDDFHIEESKEIDTKARLYPENFYRLPIDLQIGTFEFLSLQDNKNLKRVCWYFHDFSEMTYSTSLYYLNIQPRSALDWPPIETININLNRQHFHRVYSALLESNLLTHLRTDIDYKTISRIREVIAGTVNNLKVDEIIDSIIFTVIKKYFREGLASVWREFLLKIASEAKEMIAQKQLALTSFSKPRPAFIPQRKITATLFSATEIKKVSPLQDESTLSISSTIPLDTKDEYDTEIDDTPILGEAFLESLKSEDKRLLTSSKIQTIPTPKVEPALSQAAIAPLSLFSAKTQPIVPSPQEDQLVDHGILLLCNIL